MSLSTRFSRLFRADMHGLLDSLEEPEAIVRQALRDMEDDVARREADLALVHRTIELHGQRLERLARDLAELDGKLDMCLGNGKDELARTVMRRKLEVERLQQAVTARKKSAEGDVQSASRELDDCRERLTSIRQKAEILVDRPLGDSEVDDIGRHLTVTEDDIEIALLAARESRSAIQGGKGKGGPS